MKFGTGSVTEPTQKRDGQSTKMTCMSKHYRQISPILYLLPLYSVLLTTIKLATGLSIFEVNSLITSSF